MPTFPFGRPARSVPRRPSSHFPLFVLGAYPSALHIRWIPPGPWKRINAIAVDLEPEPFWNGQDEVERVNAWQRAVGWQPAWGQAVPAGKLNGSSGVWVDQKILDPLGMQRSQTWITDSLHWYCASGGGAQRIADTYEPFAAVAGLPKADLPAHPGEKEIVDSAAATELARLRAELAAVKPKIIVTLGNAALRVLALLLTPGQPNPVPRRLAADSAYGTPLRVRLAGREVRCLPLAHPAAPGTYQTAHRQWVVRSCSP